jgi:hypothetical protein
MRFCDHELDKYKLSLFQCFSVVHLAKVRSCCECECECFRIPIEIEPVPFSSASQHCDSHQKDRKNTRKLLVRWPPHTVPPHTVPPDTIHSPKTPSSPYATMEVQLYVYDLSQGLARQLSSQLLGIHIDMVYHTSIVLHGVEYFFGQGIQTCRAGQTHLGPPLQRISLGTTEIPLEIVREWLESVRERYNASVSTAFFKSLCGENRGD